MIEIVYRRIVGSATFTLSTTLALANVGFMLIWFAIDSQSTLTGIAGGLLFGGSVVKGMSIR